MTSEGSLSAQPPVPQDNRTLYTRYNDTRQMLSRHTRNQIVQMTLANNWILAYTSPVLIVFGFFCNLLLIFVLRYPRFRDQSVFLYMRLFFVANLLTLICDGGVEWICQMTDTKYISNRSETICRVWTFILYTIIHCPSWLIVGLTTDRYIRIWHSRKAVEYCTVFVAKIISTLIFIGVMAIAIHALWTFELRTHGCYLPIKPGDYHVLIWSWMQLTFIKLIPCLTVGILLVAILIGLCLGRSTNSDRSTVSGVAEGEAMKVSIVVCLQFFILNLPMIVYDLVEYAHLQAMDADLLMRVQMRLVTTVFKLLLNMAFSLSGVSVFVLSYSVRIQLAEVTKPLSNRISGCYGQRQIITTTATETTDYGNSCNNVISDTTPL